MSHSLTLRRMASGPLIAAAASWSSGAMAQAPQPAAPAPPPAIAPVAPTPVPATPAKAVERIPEGTEVKVRLDQQLSSKTAAAGDEFTIITDEPIRLPDGVVIPAGFRGRGEVTGAHKVEMMGKAGELSVRLDYVRIGDVRVHLRGNQGGEGKSMQSTAIALSLLVSPLFLLRHGHDMIYPKGQKITAYVDDSTDIPLPIAAPPAD